MSRKENLKKSLGITEYPWSSDDDDQPMPDVHLLRRQTAEPRPSVADMPGTSGQQNISSIPLPPDNKSHAEMLWTLINTPNMPSSGGVSRTRPCEASRPFVNTTKPELRERAERRADIQRVLAFKKFQQSKLGKLRPINKSYTGLYSMSSRGLSGPSRNPIFTPSITIKTQQNDLKRLQAARNPQPSFRSRSNVSSLDRLYMDMFLVRKMHPPATAAPLTSDPIRFSDTPTAERERPLPEPDLPSRIAVQPSRRENTIANPEDIEVHTSLDTVGGISLEEEIVEIDAQDDTDGNPTADQNAVVNADVELNQVITLDTTDESKHSLQDRKGESSSPKDGEPNTVTEFNQGLLRLLECPVCLEWMEPPMSQCRRGHLVCSRCRARLSNCPVCRTTFSSVRNRAMEGVAEMVHYPCRHMCGREVRLRQRSTHEANCVARRYGCPAPGCADRQPLPKDQLAQHFQSKHMSMLKIGRKHKFSMKVNSEQHDTWLVAALHEYFSLRVDVDIRTWGVIVYVAYIGPKCNAKRFTYEVSLVGQHNSRKLVYARATHSDLESVSLNVSRQDCFHLTLDQALNFLRVKNRHCEPDKFLDFNVEISKNEINTRDDSDS